MTLTDRSFFDKFNDWMKYSVTVKIFSIAFLVLILLIPASMVESLIHERQYRSEDAITEVSSIWGKAQTLSGPVISIPYKKKYINEKKEIYEKIEFAHFLPEKLNINCLVEPEKRHRGIYEVVVYTTTLKFTGSFKDFDFTEWKINNKDILWDEAAMSIGITDMRGIKDAVKLEWDGRNYLFNPGLETNDVLQTGISTRINITKDSVNNRFSFNLRLRGSQYLYFTPVGKTTNVDMRANWEHPSFQGAFLPDNYKLDENNKSFTANWQVLNLNRTYPQKWTGSIYNINMSNFGVDLIVPVDHYKKSERSAKYAIMIIAFTFLIFFFVEVLAKKRIHPIQYLLAGLALIIFYALLLAFSEHWGFNIAYIISSIATISLVTLYSKSVYKNLRETIITGLSLIILYGFVYVTLQLQDYALLMGSIGLFIIMAIIMYLTRKIDWYDMKRS